MLRPLTVTRDTRRGGWIEVAIPTFLALAFLFAVWMLTGCPSPLSPAELDAAKREEMACVDREEDAACRADRDACKTRIDICRANVREKYVKKP